MTAPTCEVCGKSTRGDSGRCTNGRCEKCHRAYCGPGGDTSPGHGRRWPSAPTIQKGTRCGCREWNCSHMGEFHPQDVEARAVNNACTRDAVRMVTVGYIGTTQQHDDGPLDVEPETLPLCESCAEYHEAKAGRL